MANSISNLFFAFMTFASMYVGIGKAEAQNLNNTRIAYSSNYHIVSSNVEGKDIKKLTDVEAYTPAWSPDGSKIAFCANLNGKFKIATINGDGSDYRVIVPLDIEGSDPSWSPDGSKIAFGSADRGRGIIYTINSDGTDLKNVSPQDSYSYMNPSWSSDGETFACEIEGNNRSRSIITFNLHTNEKRILTEGYDFDPQFSPDGNKIAFSHSSYINGAEIYVMNKDGTNMERLMVAQSRYPSWSPDGTQIAFFSSRTGNAEIFVMNADGSNPVNITNNPTNDYNPSWSPFLSPTEPTYLPSDIDQNTIVDIMDLIKVANKYGSTEKGRWDVNSDGVVDITDLILVATHLGEFSAPSRNPFDGEDLLLTTYQQMLRAETESAEKTDNFYSAMNELEKRLEKELPTRTHLMQNYPNPFNPETYIPFALGENADVRIEIYSPDGRRVREIDLGYLQAGSYATKGKAAFWDGDNSLGEKAASGTYVVELNANGQRCLGKMVVGK